MLDNLKSKYILQEIFEKIKNKRKLNIIKYNKRVMIKLDINKEDFEIYIALKEFNFKYNTNIQDIDIKTLNLSGRNIRNEELKDLNKIKFKELKDLDLGGNNISDIKGLENVKFEKLEKLDLNNNEISDIKVLEKVKFDKLKLLDLSNNKIDLKQNNVIISKMKSILKI